MASQVLLNSNAAQASCCNGRLWTRPEKSQLRQWTRVHRSNVDAKCGRAWTSKPADGKGAAQAMDARNGRVWTRPGPVGWTPRHLLGGVHPSEAEKTDLTKPDSRIQRKTKPKGC